MLKQNVSKLCQIQIHPPTWTYWKLQNHHSIASRLGCFVAKNYGNRPFRSEVTGRQTICDFVGPPSVYGGTGSLVPANEPNDRSGRSQVSGDWWRPIWKQSTPVISGRGADLRRPSMPTISHLWWERPVHLLPSWYPHTVPSPFSPRSDRNERRRNTYAVSGHVLGTHPVTYVNIQWFLWYLTNLVEAVRLTVNCQ